MTVYNMLIYFQRSARYFVYLKVLQSVHVNKHFEEQDNVVVATGL